MIGFTIQRSHPPSNMEAGLQRRKQAWFPDYGNGPGKKCGGIDLRQMQVDRKK